MDFFLPYVDQPEFEAHDTLPANSPPPLDPGADDEMDEVDDVEDNLFEGFTPVADPAFSLAFWDQGKQPIEASTSSEKDNIAIVQDLPPSPGSKKLFADNVITDFGPLDSNSMLPWDAFVQSHIQHNSEKDKQSQQQQQQQQTPLVTANIAPSDTTISTQSSLSEVSESQEPPALIEDSLLTNFDIPSDPTVFFDFPSLNLPSIKQEPTVIPQIKKEQESPVALQKPAPLAPLKRNHKYAVESTTPSSESSSSSSQDPVRSEEERKRRNRVYAKRSRDLKNMKYKEAMELNADLQKMLKQLQEENHELKLANQRLSYEVKEFKHRCRTMCE